ncbi:unnamed protein product, partial [marine sediment metagenome]
FGNRSYAFGGPGDYITIPDSRSWKFGLWDFNIDFWVRFKDVSAPRGLIGQILDNDNLWEVIYDNSANKLHFLAMEGGEARVDITCSWAPAINTWYHLSVSRSGTSMIICIDGIKQALTEPTPIGSSAMPSISAPLYLGRARLSDDWRYHRGYIDEVRIYKNKSVWSHSFEVPIAEHLDGYRNRIGDDCVLLIPADGENNSTTFTDVSRAQHAITAHAHAKISTAQYKFGGSSAYFDGDGDYLSIPDSDDWN